MADENNQEKSAKLLTVALELFRRTLSNDVAFMYANHDRGTAAPTWARAATYGFAQPTPTEATASLPPRPMPPPRAQPPLKNADGLAESPASDTTFGFAAPTTKIEPPAEKPIPLAGDRPTPYAFAPEPPKDVSNVAAYDRPQAVIIVGPNPLPVKFDKAFAEPAVVAAKEKRDQNVPTGGQAQGGAAGSMAKAIASRFLAVLGPLYALSTVLNQANSGMGVFGKAVSVLGATLAPVLLPVFALLSAAILTVSDYIWSKLLPALGGFYDWVIKFGVPLGKDVAAGAEQGVSGIGKALDFVSKTPSEVATGQKRPEEDTSRTLSFFEKIRVLVSPNKVDTIKRIAEEKVEANGGGSASGGKNPDGTPKPSIGQNFSANMRDVIKSLAMSFGPKASYASLGDVGKQAQLAALNADPIEMKAAQRIIDTFKEWAAAWERRENKTEAAPPTMARPPAGTVGGAFAFARDFAGR